VPQRLIKPQWWWQNIKSPVTFKGMMLFLAIVFLAYTVISDQQQRQASFERYKAIAQYTEESKVAIESAKLQSQNFEQSLKNTTALLQYMDQITRSMHEVAEILKINREEAAKEHKIILRQGSPGTRRKSKTFMQSDCWQLKPRTQQIGNNTVTVQEFVRMPCQK
jgi:hypothetical protein